MSGWGGGSIDFRSSHILGQTPGGGKPLAISCHCDDIQILEAPFLCWDRKRPYTFRTAAAPLELVSTNANDNATGTGARAVLIETLDGNYLEQSQIVIPNGLTPVQLTGTHLYLHVNKALVIDAGSAHTNLGNIQIRTPGTAGQDNHVQGFIKNNISVMRAILFTAPAGHHGMLDRVYVQTNNPGGIIATVKVSYLTRLVTGVIVDSQDFYFHSPMTPPSMIILDTGCIFPEKSTFHVTLSSASANGALFSLMLAGWLINDTHLK